MKRGGTANTDPCIRKGLSFKERGSRDYHAARPHEELLVVCPAAGEGGLGLTSLCFGCLARDIGCLRRIVQVRIIEYGKSGLFLRERTYARGDVPSL